jgi:hypothetical protein
MAAVRTNFVTAEISHTITTYTLQWRGKVCSHFAPHLGRHKFRDPFAAPTQPFKDPRLATRQARNAITAEDVNAPARTTPFTGPTPYPPIAALCIVA